MDKTLCVPDENKMPRKESELQKEKQTNQVSSQLELAKAALKGWHLASTCSQLNKIKKKEEERR
jgi:hypothetical protein